MRAATSATNSGTDFLDDDGAGQAGNKSADCSFHAAPVAITLRLGDFLQGVEMYRQCIGLDGIDSALCEINAAITCQLDTTGVTDGEYPLPFRATLIYRGLFQGQHAVSRQQGRHLLRMLPRQDAD